MTPPDAPAAVAGLRRGAVALAASLLSAMTLAAPPPGCDGTPQLHDATAATVRAFVRQQHRQVLTLAGYSGAGYQDPAAMLDLAARVLDTHRPADTLVNIGATADGIGAVYALAKQRGFTTMGIVSTRARDDQLPLSPCVDHVFFITDSTWGGLRPGSKTLSPTSQVMVSASTWYVAIGGGEITRDEAQAAQRRGKVVRFAPADQNHQAARDKARQRGQPEPTDFRGAAHSALAALRAP
jgi:hypothetical protein